MVVVVVVIIVVVLELLAIDNFSLSNDSSDDRFLCKSGIDCRLFIVLIKLTDLLDLAMSSAECGGSETVAAPLRLNAKSVASSGGSEFLGPGLNTADIFIPIPITRQVALAYMHVYVCIYVFLNVIISFEI